MQVAASPVLDELTRQSLLGPVVNLTDLWECAGRPVLTPEAWNTANVRRRKGNQIAPGPTEESVWACRHCGAADYAGELLLLRFWSPHFESDPVGAILALPYDPVVGLILDQTVARLGGVTRAEAADYLSTQAEAKFAAFDESDRTFYLDSMRESLGAVAVTQAADSGSQRNAALMWDPASVERPSPWSAPGAPDTSARTHVVNTVKSTITFMQLSAINLRDFTHDVSAIARTVKAKVDAVIACQPCGANWDGIVARGSERQLIAAGWTVSALEDASEASRRKLRMKDPLASAVGAAFQIQTNDATLNVVGEEWKIDWSDAGARDWFHGVARAAFDEFYRWPGLYDAALARGAEPAK